MHQIIEVRDIAPEMNAQFQDGESLGAGAVDNTLTRGVPTSVREPPAFSLQEVFRILLLAQAIYVHGLCKKAVFDPIQQFRHLPSAELG